MPRKVCVGLVLAAACLVVRPQGAIAGDTAAQIGADAKTALTSLYAKTPAAKAIGEKAAAVLVFPKITKAGFVVGGEHGDGALLKGGRVVAYYKTTGASIGLQAGAQTYGYALFFMNAKALQQLDRADGFEIGVGPTVVVVDEGAAANLTTTTARDDIYAFVFGQKGLMAGVSLQGNKIGHAHPK